MTRDPRFLPCEGIYLQSHSAGRPPASVADALGARFIAPWAQGREEPWPRWLAAIEDFRTALGAALGGDPQDFCPQDNLSAGLAKLLGAITPEQGRRVALLHEDDFPSMGFVLGRAGLTLRFMPREVDPRDVEAWRTRIDETVAVVLVTQVQSNTGRRLPVEQICGIARATGALAVVDIAQSAGVLPMRLAALDADAVLGSCLKWLCGGPGAGFLWVSPRVIPRCAPRDVGWFSHAEPFAFDIHDYRDHPGVLRFWGGTPSVLPFVVATEGLRLIASIGVEAVRAHNLRLSRLLIDALPESAVFSPREDAQRGGTVVLQFGAAQPAAVAQLRAIGVRFDDRPTGMRLSPHIYNTAEEMNRVIAALMAAHPRR